MRECVASGYPDRADSVIPLVSPAYLGKVAPTVTATPGDRGIVGFGVFVAWCCELRRGAIADFPDIDIRADADPEVTVLARCLDVAMIAPSWSHYASPRLGRVLAERVSGRLVSEVPDLVDLAQAARRGRTDRHRPRCGTHKDRAGHSVANPEIGTCTLNPTNVTLSARASPNSQTRLRSRSFHCAIGTTPRRTHRPRG